MICDFNNNDKYVLTMDASAFTTEGNCELLWAYLYRENLRLTGQKSEAMDKGSLVHLFLEAYYKAKAKYPELDSFVQGQRALDAVYKHPLVTETYFDKEVIQHIKTRFIEYVSWWYNKDFKPLVTNDIAAVELGFSKVLYEDDDKIFVIEGKIDLLAELDSPEPGRTLGIVDHKSESKLNPLYPYTPQVKTYSWATGIENVMINYFGLQQEAKEHTFRRTMTQIPQWMKEQWEAHMLRVCYKIWANDTLKDKTNEEKFKRNWSHCAGSYSSRPCIFTYLCETNPQNIGLLQNLKNFKYEKVEKWEPWKLGSSLEV